MSNTVFTWAEREIWLRSFTCDCGWELSEPVRFHEDSDNSLTCDSCNAVYELFVTARLFKDEDVETVRPPSSMNLQSGEMYSLVYISSISKNEKTVEVEVENGLLVDDDEQTYEVEDGVVRRDGRKLGEYQSLDT